MNHKNPLLQEAYRLYCRKRYRDSIVVLEKILSSGGREAYVHFLLAVNFLLDAQLNRIEDHLKKSKLADPGFLPSIHLDLFLSLKSAENAGNALSKYLDAFQKFPADPFIRKGIASLRESGDFPAFQKKAKLHDFVRIPKPAGKGKILKITFLRGRRNFRLLKVIVASFFIIILAGAIIFTMYENRGMLTGIFRHGMEKQRFTVPREVEMITIEKDRYDLLDKINKDRTPVFYYSNDEIYQDFTRARGLIKNEKYNDALLVLNRLLNSNANFSVKERADFLKDFLLHVEDREYSTINIGEVSQNPYLYRGILVHWKGKVANLKRKDGRLLFHLLTEYRHHDQFSGIAEVYSEKDFGGIKNGAQVAVKALFNDTIGGDRRIYLVAKDIVALPIK